MKLSPTMRRLPVLLTAAMALLSTCAAQLETRSSFATATTPVAVAVGDFNHDGFMDLATASLSWPDEVQVFLGNGNGTFGAPTAYDVGPGTGPIATADVNGDGNLDLIVVNGACPNQVCYDSVAVLLGNGDGTFQAPMNFSTPPRSVSLVVGDFNGDGFLDIATVNQADYTTECDCIGVLLGDGDGTFQPPIITYPSRGLPWALVAGHFSKGKNLDLAVTIGLESSSEVQVLPGNGDGTFALGDV
jgi:FG-GAP-like repeat/FG-GAP repeat